jgi:hypothetical protein
MSSFIRVAGVLALGLLVACGKSSTVPPAADFAGTWTATRVEYRAAGSSDVVDAVATGSTLTLSLSADHTFEFTVTSPGGNQNPPCLTCGDGTFQGTWDASVDVFTLTPSGLAPGSQWQFDFSLSANNLTLTGANNEYDFNGDGVREQARWNLYFMRQ